MARDGISDPILNCILEVCCGAAAAQSALADEMVAHGASDKAHAPKSAKFIFEYFDLAEKGTLKAFKKSILRVDKAKKSEA